MQSLIGVLELRELTYFKVANHTISTGNLQRYLDWNNIKDPFNVILGITKSTFHKSAIR